jgi:hypothetical protein
VQSLVPSELLPSPTSYEIFQFELEYSHRFKRDQDLTLLEASRRLQETYGYLKCVEDGREETGGIRPPKFNVQSLAKIAGILATYLSITKSS